MPNPVPHLDLSLGQMLWAIRYGQEPNQLIKDQVRYLRLLDIPQASAKQASGPGNRVRYGFYDLIELGLAVTALDLGFRPKDLASVLAGKREGMRKAYDQAWLDLPELALSQSWVKSRGKEKVLMENEVPLRLHDRHSDKWGQIDFVSAEEANEELPVLELVERFDNEPPRRVLPLKRLMLQWVAWALDAPEIRPGRR